MLYFDMVIQFSPTASPLGSPVPHFMVWLTFLPVAIQYQFEGVPIWVAPINWWWSTWLAGALLTILRKLSISSWLSSETKSRPNWRQNTKALAQFNCFNYDKYLNSFKENSIENLPWKFHDWLSKSSWRISGNPICLEIFLFNNWLKYFN